MTRTCSQCSHFRPIQPSGRPLDCPLFGIGQPATTPACELSVNGWDVEWKASGMRWELYEDEDALEGDEIVTWELFRGTECLGQCWSKLGGPWSAYLDSANDNIFTCTLAECCRALIARVKGDPDV